jgi:hypothetical protein
MKDKPDILISDIVECHGVAFIKEYKSTDKFKLPCKTGPKERNSYKRHPVVDKKLH